ncbi:3503_t:CDS:2, partial [Gigaspora rosea]
ERTLGKGTRFKSESQEKVRNNQPQRKPARRNPRREIWCPYDRTEGYATHTGPDVRKLEIKYAALFETLTEKKAAEVQEIINKVFVPVSPGPRNHLGSVRCKETLEKPREVDLSRTKPSVVIPRNKKLARNHEPSSIRPQNKNLTVTKVLELYYDLKIPDKDGVEDTTREQGELKQEKSIKPEPKEPASQSKDKNGTILKTKNEEEKINHFNKTNKPGISHEAYEPHKESAKRNPEDNKKKNLGIGTKREETFYMSNVTVSKGSI